VINYKDQAWCQHSQARFDPEIPIKCGRTACDRNYTYTEARRNKSNLPIAICDFKTATCGFRPTIVEAA